MKKNAFRYPNDADAEIPQAKAPVYIDRRTSAAPTRFLMKEMGEKKKNIIKREHAEHLKLALIEAGERGEGKFREKEIIDINSMVTFDEYGNIDMSQLNMDKVSIGTAAKKTPANKTMGMDIDTDMKTSTRRNKRKKQTKSGKYLVNY